MRRLSNFFLAVCSFLVVVASFFPVSAMARPAVLWQPDKLVVDAVSGSHQMIDVSFSVMRDMSDARLRIVPELKAFVRVDPVEFGTLHEGENRTVSLRIDLPAGLSSRQVKGTLHLETRRGPAHATAARPLPILLNIQEAPSSRLLVTAFRDAEDVLPVPGARVLLDGAFVGLTDETGSLEIETSPGAREVAVVDPGLAAARLSVTLEPGERASREFVLSGEGLTLVEDYRLEMAEVSGGILQREAQSLTLSLVRPDASVIALTDIAMIDAIGIAPGSADPETGEGIPLGSPQSLIEFFSLSDGGTRIIANDPATVRAILSQLPGQGQIVVLASNRETGLTYHAFVTFSIGAATIDGQLLSPPSNPSLRLDGVPVLLDVPGTADRIETVSDLAGAFFFNDVPLGLVTVSAETTDGEIVYVGSGTAFIDRDKEVTLRLLTTIDIIDGVDDFTIVDAFFNSFGFDEEPPSLEAEALAVERQRLHETWLAGDGGAAPPSLFAAEADEMQVSITVIGGAEDETVKDTQTLEIPSDTEQLALRYTIATEEYPDFVLEQSEFNDTWFIEVLGSNGQQLFDISRNVNSQVRVQPLWRADGSTGEIIETIDLTSLPPTNEMTRMITVSAETQNIGDDALPTTVSATLSTDPALEVKLVSRTSRTVSIPRSGGRNTFPFVLSQSIVGPMPPFEVTTSDLTAIISYLILGATGVERHRIVDEPGIGGPVRSEGTKNFDIEVSFGGGNPMTSPADGTPPDAHNVQYQMEITGIVNDEEQMAEVTASGPVGLWVMPDGIPRFGRRDQGGDAWASRGAYLWIDSNRTLLSRVNDISGEHGRNIGHSTHKNGTDIDIFHFGIPLFSTLNGALNYNAAETLAMQALAGDSGARTSLNAWISAQRTGIQALNNNAMVARLIGPNGRATTSLPDGWLRSLIVNGQFTDSNGNVLLIGGSLAASKAAFMNDHNDHYHIDLDDQRLVNTP